MDKRRLVIDIVLALVFVSASLSTALAGQRYRDDFTQPSRAWRFGNAVLSRAPGGLLLNAHYPEATLAGTVLHPDNLNSFSATIDWSFGKNGKPVLIIGWGKPFEWSPLSECFAHLIVDRQGHVTAKMGETTIGTAELAVGESGVLSVTAVQRPGQIVLRGAGKEAVLPLPVQQETPGGFFTLRVQGLAPGEEPVKVCRVEIESAGNQPAFTEAERMAACQQWAAEKVHANWRVLEKFEQYLQAENAAGRWGFKTDLRVEPGLVKPGEKVRVTFRYQGAEAPQSEAQVEADFLRQARSTAQPLVLDWRTIDGVQQATVELEPQQCGNWRIIWRVGGEQLSRTFGVVDRGYAVFRFLITNDKALNKPDPQPAAHDAIHDAGLSADHWDGAEWTSPFSRTPENLLEHFRLRAELRHRWGDSFMPMCNANWMIPGCPDTNLWHLDDATQSEGLRQICRLWDLLNLGPLETLASYTWGHSTPRIARSVGIKMLDSLCQWQNWRDGADDNAWLINHWGAPTTPYYVADDDFRKVAPGKSIVAFTQSTTSNVRAFTIMALETQPQLSFMRRRPAADMAESANIDRFQTAVDLLLAEAPQQSEPLFLSVGLENFVDSVDWNEANRRGVRYVCEQARSKNIVIAQSAAIADFYQRHYQHQPECWFYWPDIYAGFQHSHKPQQLADRIELSNAQFHSVHDDGQVLPRFFWDYTRTWSEPVWDDQTTIREKYGLVTPQLLRADNCVPRMVDLSGVTAEITITPQPEGVVVQARVDAPRDLGALPLGVWRIPLQSNSCEVAELSPGARFVPVVDGSTGNLHGLLVCDHVNKGNHTWKLRLRGQSRPPLEPTFNVGNQVRGRTFQRADGTTAYVWLEDANKSGGTLVIPVPPGRHATVHYNDGQVDQSREGVLRVTLQRDWRHESPMISGLTAAEIQAAARFEP